jgi:anti-anti-sigma factor
MSKILVIDDERATLSMFRLFLGAYGYEVLTAENGAAGLELVRKERPPIVITDIKMPGMDGIEVLQRIKEIDPETEVIVITGHGDMDLAIEALDLNATDFINKPIQKEALDLALGRAEQRLNVTKSGEENEISLRTVDGITIIDIQGNVTSRTEPLLFDAYEKASSEGGANIVLHFDKISSINGEGINILFQLLTRSKQRNQRVVISGVYKNIKKVFEMIGITRFAKIIDREDEAIDSLIQRRSPPKP